MHEEGLQEGGMKSDHRFPLVILPLQIYDSAQLEIKIAMHAFKTAGVLHDLCVLNRLFISPIQEAAHEIFSSQTMLVN